MPTLAELELRIKSLEAVKATKNLDSLTQASKKTATSSKKLESQFDRQDKVTQKLNKSYATMGQRLKTLAAGISAVLILRQATTVFAEFEQKMAEVGGVSKAVGAQFEALTEQARQLGAVTRFSARQAADAQLALVRAGFSVNDTLKTSKAVLDLASGAQLELGRSAEITAITMRQFRLESEDAVKITDILVNTANSATTNVENLAQALKFSGSIASSFGKSLESTAAALGVIADAGLDASQAGTGLRGVFSRLGDPIGKAAATLDTLADRLGKTRKIFDITENSLADIFQAFKEAGASTQDFIRIFGRLQAPAALALVNNVEKIRELTEANKEAGGTAAELAKIMNDTLKGSLLALKSAVEELFISIGDGVLGKAFRGLVDLLRDTALALSNFEDGTTKISLLAKTLAFTIKVLTASLAAYGARLAIVAIETASARVATLGFAAALRTMRTALISTGIGIAVVAIGELVAALSDSNDAISDIADEFEDFEKAQKKSTAATKEQTKALEDLNRARLAGTAALQTTLDRFNDATIKLDRLFAGASEQSLKDLQTFRDLLRLNTEAAKQRFGVTKLTIAQQTQVLAGTKQIIAIEKNLADVLAKQEKARDAAADALKERLDAQKKLSRFLGERELAVEESGLTKFEVGLDRLQKKFEDVFLAAKGVAETFDLSDVDFSELLAGLDLILEQQKAIAQNDVLQQLAQNAKKAGQALNDALRSSREELDRLKATASDRTLIDTQREFAAAVEDTLALLEAQNATPDELISGLVKVNDIIADIATNRGLATLIQDGKAAEQSMRALEESLQGALTPLQEFTKLSETALAGYKAELDGTVGAQDAFSLKQQEMNERILEFEKNLEAIALSEKLGAVAEGLVGSFQTFFDTIITGSKNAGEAATDLFREISRLALQKFAIEPLVDALKAGIGTLVKGAAGGGSVLASANGNAFRNGNVQAFANGGIIGGPSLFPLGLAGEKGPEAILPLKRDSQGRLGVAQVDSRPQRRATLRRPFTNASVSTGASSAPSRQEMDRGGTRIINQQLNVTSLDPNAFRQSSTQIQADALRSARLNRF